MAKKEQPNIKKTTYYNKEGLRTTEELAFRKLTLCYDQSQKLIQSSLSIRFSLADRW